MSYSGGKWQSGHSNSTRYDVKAYLPDHYEIEKKERDQLSSTLSIPNVASFPNLGIVRN